VLDGEGPCTSCAGASDGVPVLANLLCATSSGATRFELRLGCSTSNACHSISGANTDEAYWLGVSPASELTTALCCSL